LQSACQDIGNQIIASTMTNDSDEQPSERDTTPPSSSATGSATDDDQAADDAIDVTILVNSRGATPDEGVPGSIGKYVIRDLLGKGGQASVFLAFDPDLQRHVVIKLYHDLQSSRDRDRVLSEGRSLVRVESAWVAKCFGADHYHEQPYLILEYIRGESLDRRFRNGTPEIDEALDLIRQIFQGLAAIHAAGLIHRDIKPSNILIGDNGRPQITDFGLAAAVASSALAETSGTLAFMAPEQARGDFARVDQRADLFAAGGVLYFLLAGRPPYAAKGVSKLLELAQQGRVTDVGEIVPGLPDPVRSFCMKCLETSPENRFESASVARQELEQLIRSRSKRRSRARLLVGMPLAVIVSGLVIAFVVIPALRPDRTTDSDTANASSVSPVKATRALDGASGHNVAAVADANYQFATTHPDGRPLRMDFPLEVLVVEQIRKTNGWIEMQVGEEIAVQVEARQTCYIYVWMIQPEAALQVFPNEAESNQRLLAGDRRRIPGPPDVPGQAAQTLVADSSSTGLEYLHVVASDLPIEGLAGSSFGPYSLLRGKDEVVQLAGKLRDFSLRDRTDLLDATQASISEVIIPIRVQQ
jgi:serine/threonine protein kinase